MNKVIHLTHPKAQSTETEAAFVGLLAGHCDQPGTVKPLPNTFFDRIEQLKAKAEAAQQRQDAVLLEG